MRGKWRTLRIDAGMGHATECDGKEGRAWDVSDDDDAGSALPRVARSLPGEIITVAARAAAGVHRVSVGGALARVAWGAFLDARARDCPKWYFLTTREGGAVRGSRRELPTPHSVRQACRTGRES
jgi:hypothetical protein